MIALKGKPFAWLWSGQSISMLGDRIFQVALAWWVLEATGSAAAMGAVLLFSSIPMLVFLLAGGALVDRFPRTWLMLVADLARGLAVMLAAVLAARGRLAIGHVYAISLVSGLVEAFFSPAYRAVLPDLTPSEHLTSANSLTSLSRQFAGIAGPTAGALLVSAGGTPLAFAIDAASFFASALCILPLLRPAGAPEHRAGPASVLADVREGLRAVLASPWLWVTIGVAGLSNLTYAGPMEVVLPFLIRQHRQAGVETLGLFYSSMSVGAVAAALWMGRIRRLRRRGLVMYAVWMVIGLMVVLTGLPVPILLLWVAAFLIGACNSILSLVWVNTLQENVPRRLLGRVTSVDYLGSSLLEPAGYALGGWAAERAGPAPVFILGGLLQTGLVFLGLLHPKVRSLD